MLARKRWLAIAAAGIAVGGLAWFAPPPAQDVLQPATREQGAQPAGAVASKASSRFAELPRREGIGEPAGELFAPRAVAPVPKPAPVAQAPAAPPNPYRVAGVLVQEGASRVFLTKGERVYEVKEGEALDDTYRIEAIGAAQVTLLYLPLGTRDVLPIQSALAVDAPAARPDAPVAADKVVQGEEAGRPAQLRWEGPERVAGGASFSVALRLTTSEPLRASPMQLRFEPDVLEAVSVRAGKFYGRGSFSYRVNPEGSIFVGASSQAPAPGADAELVVFTFRPVRRGATAEVRVSSLALQGTAGRTIAHERLTAFRAVIQ